MSGSLSLVLANLRRHRFRSMVTMISVMIAVGTAIIAAAALQRIESMRAASDSAPRVEIISPVIRHPLPYSFIPRIQSLPHVKGIHWIRGTVGTLDNQPPYDLWAGSSDYPKNLAALMSVPPDQLETWKNDRQGILVSPSLLAELGKRRGDAVVLHSYVGDVSGQIDGMIGGFYGSDQLAIVHWEELSTIENKSIATTISALCDPADYSTVIKEIDEAFASSTEPVLAEPQADFMNTIFFGPDMLVTRMFLWISALMLTITILITASTLATSLRERRADFGVLRSLGFTRSMVVRMVLLETSIVCLTAGVLAAVICLVVLHGHGIDLSEFVLANFSVPPTFAAMGVGVSALIALLSGLWPAVNIARVDVVEALGKA